MSYPYLRLVLAISLDGRIAYAKGDNENIGGEGDRKVLEEALAWSDATLMGSGTLSAHKSTCLIRSSKLIEERLSKGKSAQPISLVIGSKIKFSNKWLFFNQPIQRWSITKDKLAKGYLAKTKFDHIIEMNESWSATLKDLKEKGLSNIVILGGAKLIGSLLKEDKIDEMQLTLSPKILGGECSWVELTNTDIPIELSQSDSWSIKEIKPLECNELVLIYVRNR